MTPKQKSQKKPVSVRKQWKLLAEYALAREGKPEKMACDDTLYEDGPTVGSFLINHYVSRCISPAMKIAAAKAVPGTSQATPLAGIIETPVDLVTVQEPEPSILVADPESPRPPTPDSMMSLPPSPQTPACTKRRPLTEINNPAPKKTRPVKKLKLVEPKESITLLIE